ncbi:N-alpha-acetyltransferase 30 [Sorochytrium milnesiophthora]
MASANVAITTYPGESSLPSLTSLIENDLSEPYSIYTYRYFLHSWPELTFFATDQGTGANIGVIVCKLDRHREVMRGYIAMLAVRKEHRKRGVGSLLVQTALRQMRERRADEVVLEAEVTNIGALNLYENLGFIRDKRLSRYYLNGADAFRLKMWL